MIIVIIYYSFLIVKYEYQKHTLSSILETGFFPIKCVLDFGKNVPVLVPCLALDSSVFEKTKVLILIPSKEEEDDDVDDDEGEAVGEEFKFELFDLYSIGSHLFTNPCNRVGELVSHKIPILIHVVG
jgi:hypothetical protein